MLVYFAKYIYIYRTFLELKVLDGAAIYKYLNIHLWGMPLEIAWVYHYYTCSSGTLMQAPRAYKVWMRGVLRRYGIISSICKQNREDLAPQNGQNCLMQDNPHNIYTWKFTMWSVHQRSFSMNKWTRYICARGNFNSDQITDPHEDCTDWPRLWVDTIGVMWRAFWQLTTLSSNLIKDEYWLYK